MNWKAMLLILVVLFCLGSGAAIVALETMNQPVNDWFYIVPGYETGYTEEWGVNLDGTAWLNVNRAPDDAQFVHVWPDHHGAGPAGQEVIYRIVSRQAAGAGRVRLELAR